MEAFLLWQEEEWSMEKLKSLNGYQKGLLIFMTVMALVFAIVYPQI